MAEDVEFILRLQDQMTASLRSGAEYAQKLEQALDKIVGKLEKTEQEERKEKAEEEGMFTRAVEKGEIFKDILEEVARKVFELGSEFARSVVDITDFEEKAEIALRHLNGNTAESEVQTKHFLGEAHKFANDAALPVDQVTEAFLGLKRAGLSDEWVRPLAAAAGDLAGLSGHSDNFRAISSEFEQIALKGELGGRALLSLQRDGINTAALAARLGAHDFRELQEQLSRQPLEASKALRAIEDVIKSTAHEDFLGQVLKEQGDQTFGGAITRIKNAFTELVDGFNENPVFRTLREDFTALANDVLAHLPTWEAQFSAAFDPVLKALDQLVKNPDTMKNAFEGALHAVESISAAAGAIIRVLDFIVGHKDVLETGVAAAAGAIAAGPVGSAAAGTAVAYSTGRSESISDLTRAGYSEREASRYTGHAFAEGGPVSETGQALVHEGEYVIPVGGAPVVRSGGDGGRGSVHAPISINVHVDGGGAGLTEEGLALKLQELLPGALVSPLEKLAATVGAT